MYSKDQIQGIRLSEWVLVISCVWPFVILQIITHQAPLSMEDSPGKNTEMGYQVELSNGSSREECSLKFIPTVSTIYFL